MTSSSPIPCSSFCPSSILRALLTVMLVPACVSYSLADEKAPDTEAAPDMEQIDGWVAELGHQQLTRRVKAKKNLLKAGKTAIPSLARAALSDKREAIERSIDVLGTLSQSQDEETADAARVTLKMLTESNKPSTAERARSVLNTKQAEGIKPFEGWDKPGNPFAGGGRNRSVSVSSINGVRTIKVVENGQETVIQEVPRRGIRVETVADGKPVKVLAKDAADLRKRLPDVYALYEQYTSGPAMPAGFGPLGPFGQVGGFPLGNGNPAANANGGQAFSLQMSGQGSANQMLTRQLKELRRRMAGNPAMQKLLDQQIEAVSPK